MTKKNIRQLAEEHWNWLAPILNMTLSSHIDCIKIMRYLFITAMEHGYKHGTADKTKNS